MCVSFGRDNNVTPHSLRRGATPECQGVGLTLDHMAAGTWQSDAVKSYLQAIHISAVPTALSQLLG